jgi:hypothetical protein
VCVCGAERGCGGGRGRELVLLSGCAVGAFHSVLEGGAEGWTGAWLVPVSEEARGPGTAAPDLALPGA